MKRRKQFLLTFALAAFFVAGNCTSYAEQADREIYGEGLYGRRAVEPFQYERPQRLDPNSYNPESLYYRRYPYDRYAGFLFRGHPYYGDMFPYSNRYPLMVRPPYGYRYPDWYIYPYRLRSPYGNGYYNDYYYGYEQRYYRYYRYRDYLW